MARQGVEWAVTREEYTLGTGSRIGVIGGGPAGSFFSYFLLTMASRLGYEIEVEIYEPRDFTRPGPAGCNMCGGIVYESLVQLLAMEGIVLPPDVVQRGIDSYVLHMDVGTVRIEPPGREKRIAAVHRGAGPRGLVDPRWHGFDDYLLRLTEKQGAKVIHERVEGLTWEDGRPRLSTRAGISREYDLVVGAYGVNSSSTRLFEGIGSGYAGPTTTKAFIADFLLGERTVETCLGSSMHVFLLDLPRLEFAAIIPKRQYATVCLLGQDIDKELVDSFFHTTEAQACFPAGWSPPANACRCSPSINIVGASRPFGDRFVFVGDCGENRLYKDGIGGAYRTAKAAAKTAMIHGVSAEHFRRHFLPVCNGLSRDNRIGKAVFLVITLIRRLSFLRKGLWRVTVKEQSGNGSRRMSGVLWDTFTGSASYRDVFLRTLNPVFLGRFLYETLLGMLPTGSGAPEEETMMGLEELGKVYGPGEVIVRKGEIGECMYVIQSGKAEVVSETDGREFRLAELGEGDFFGEMALFEKEVRSATVRPLGEVRVLTVDKRLFLRKIHDDPSLAFRIMQRMSSRIRDLNNEIMRLKFGS
jgi:hypothetical protein